MSAIIGAGVGPDSEDGGQQEGGQRGRRGARAAAEAEYSRQDWWERGREIVIRQLSMMDRSRVQLSDAMARRGVPEDVRGEVLDHFEGLGLIDDEHFAQALVRTRFAERGSSRRAIGEELRRKGVDERIVEEAVGLIDDEAEFDAAVTLACKRMERADGNPATLERRVYAALARRGYSPEVCSRALGEARRRTLG
ncbi:MAG: regulatory protein RecX [Actinomycetaceae bacterium]|nr:regulatory protein RecX [Actinomycetaceae bacterium]